MSASPFGLGESVGRGTIWRGIMAMKILEDFRAIIVGFIGAILFTLYLEHRGSIMGFTIIFIVFSFWLMLVIWNQKKKIEQGFPLADWLTGEDLMKYFKISQDQLRQLILKGLKVYPRGDDVLYHGDEVPPLSEEDLVFEITDDGYSAYRFKKADMEKLIKKKNT